MRTEKTLKGREEVFEALMRCSKKDIIELLFEMADRHLPGMLDRITKKLDQS